MKPHLEIESHMPTQVDHAEIKLRRILTMLLAVLAFVTKQPVYLIALGAVFLVREMKGEIK